MVNSCVNFIAKIHPYNFTTTSSLSPVLIDPKSPNSSLGSRHTSCPEALWAEHAHTPWYCIAQHPAARRPGPRWSVRPETQGHNLHVPQWHSSSTVRGTTGKVSVLIIRVSTSTILSARLQRTYLLTNLLIYSLSPLSSSTLCTVHENDEAPEP